MLYRRKRWWLIDGGVETSSMRLQLLRLMDLRGGAAVAAAWMRKIRWKMLRSVHHGIRRRRCRHRQFLPRVAR